MSVYSFAAALLPVALSVLVLGRSCATARSVLPGEQLERGMELVYASEGSAQPPWTIDSLRLGVSLRPGAECSVIHVRRRSSQPAEENRWCVAHDTLYRWDGGISRWSISRPVGPQMIWSSTRPDGDVVRYETGGTVEERISGRPIIVVITTVTTTDSAGNPKRRLRERFALTLLTATGGVFETPDPNDGATWVTSNAFELREIRVP